jgi:hypothetical protein
VVRDLRSLCGPALSVVVAVEPARLGEVAGLQRAGADEVVPWDGRAESVAWAIQRALASRAPGAAAPAGAEARPSASPPPRPATPQAAASPSPPPRRPSPQEAAAAPGAAPSASPPPVLRSGAPSAAFTIRETAPAPAGGAAWPSEVPDGPSSEVRLAAAASAPAAPGDTVGRVALSLSDLESRALTGQPVPLDAAVLRHTAALRLRVALALESAPQPGSAHDAAAVQSLLAEIDAVLAALKDVGAALPAPYLAQADALRNVLVKEAIDLTDAVQRIAPHAPPPEAPTVAERRPPRREERAAVETEWMPQRTASRGRWLLPALLLASALAAAGYHGWQLLQKRTLAQRVRYSGAPAGMKAVGSPDAPVLVDEEGKAPHPVVLQQFKEEQAARGKAVLEAGPGVLLVVPQPPPPPAGGPTGGKP